MADGTSLRFSVVVAADDAQAQLKAVSAAFNEAGVKGQVAMRVIQGGAGQAKAGVEGFAGALRNLKAEQTQQARQARFFANEIASIAPASGAAQTALQGVIGAGIELSSGFTKLAGVMAAFELAKGAIALVREDAKIARERVASLAEAQKTFNDASVDGWKRIGEMTLVVTEAQKAYNAELLASNSQIEKVKKNYADTAKAGLSTLASLTDVFGGTGVDDYSTALGKVLAIEHALEAAARNRAAIAAAITQETQRTLAATRAQKVISDLQEKAREGFEVTSDQPTPISFLPGLGTPDTTDIAGPFSQKVLAQQNAAMLKSEKDQQESAHKMVTLWSGAGDAVGTALGNAMAAFAAGTGSAADAVKGLAVTVIQSAKSIIQAYILSAEAAAAFSQAGIPVVGPILAGIAVSTVAALLGGLMSQMPSAAGGFDVGDINPITQLHAREMVLPAHLAEKVRSMTDGGTGPTTINVYALDSRSFYQAAKDNRLELVRVLQGATKDRVYG